MSRASVSGHRLARPKQQKQQPDAIRSIEPYLCTRRGLGLGLYPVNDFRRATPGARIHAACARLLARDWFAFAVMFALYVLACAVAPTGE